MATKIETPYPIFEDVDGQPLESGYIYIGTAGLDPVTNPITVYSDASLSTVVTQPVRTTAGYPVVSGSPIRLYTGATDFSLKVANKNTTQIHQNLNAGAAQREFSNVVEDSSGNIAIDGTTFNVDSVNNRVGVGTASPGVPLDVIGNIRSSTGILFGTDTAAANALDDYEEGTWTPSIGGTATYTHQFGSYTKIGDKVNCWFDVSLNIIGTGSQSNISGLPFTVGSGLPDGTGYISYFLGTAASVVSMYARADGATTTVILSGAVTADSSSVGTSAILGDGARVVGSITYKV